MWGNISAISPHCRFIRSLTSGNLCIFIVHSHLATAVRETATDWRGSWDIREAMGKLLKRICLEWKGTSLSALLQKSSGDS